MEKKRASPDALAEAMNMVRDAKRLVGPFMIAVDDLGLTLQDVKELQKAVGNRTDLELQIFIVREAGWAVLSFQKVEVLTAWIQAKLNNGNLVGSFENEFETPQSALALLS